MKILKLFFLFLLITISFNSFAQKNCSYKIDTVKILSNKNLDKFILNLQTQKFTEIIDKKEIPTSVKKQLDCLTEGFSIANPDQAYACCCMSSPELPKRKLVYLSKSENTLVMTYLTGGFAVMTHLLLIEFDKNKIIDLWTGYCSKNLNSNKEIIKYLKDNKNKQHGFYRDKIYL